MLEHSSKAMNKNARIEGSHCAAGRRDGAKGTERECLARVLPGLVLAAVASIPVSITAAQVFGYLSLVLWIIQVSRKRVWREVWQNPLLPWMLLFVVLAVLVSMRGVRPAESLVRLRRLSMLSLACMIVMFFSGAKHAWRGVPGPMVALAAGITILGLYDLVRVPLEIRAGVSWFDAGNMRDPQMYMTGLCFLLAARPLFAGRREDRWRKVLILLFAAGLVLHFKRGAWMAFVCAALAMALRTRRWTIPVLAAGLVLVSLLMPPVRDRLETLRAEVSVEHGGRMALWTRVAPQLIREHPAGMGFLATRHEDFQDHGCFIAPRLNHLHNNMLQVLVELGPAGLAVWLGWMIATGLLLWRAARPRREVSPGRSAAAVGCWGAFIGLMINGLVEYNFGHSEILMLLAVLMGLAVLLSRPGRQLS